MATISLRQDEIYDVPPVGGEYSLNMTVNPVATKLEIASAPSWLAVVELVDKNVPGSGINCAGYFKLRVTAPKIESHLGRRGEIVIQEVCKSSRCKCASVVIPINQIGDVALAPEQEVPEGYEWVNGPFGPVLVKKDATALRLDDLEKRVAALEAIG